MGKLLLPNSSDITVIIPAYNETESIGEVICRIKETIDCDIVVVDDGSTDDTSIVATQAGARVVKHKKNRGLTQALKSGIRTGLESGAKILINIDADGQYLPEDIPKLIQPIVDGEADLVLGSRLAGEIEEMPALKKIGNRMFTYLIRLLTGFPFTDTQTGFRAFTREFAYDLFFQGKYTYTQDMLIQAVERGYSIKEIPIFFAKRKHGESRLIANPFAYAFKAFSIVLRTYRDFHPLKVFGLLGFLFFGSGLILGLTLLYSWLTTGVIGRTPSVILTMLLITLGVQSFVLAFLADMIRNVREELRESIKYLRMHEDKE